MTDAEKKDTLCIFITPSERVEKNDDEKNIYGPCFGNEKKYFENFCTHGILQLEDADELINEYGIDAINDNDVKNVQMIFDIHGDKEGLSISEEEMHKILEPIFASLKDKKIEIIMANCQGNLKFKKGNLKFKKNNGHESLPEYLKEMAKTYGVKPENISLYCMPKGHGAAIQFNKNGDIFFVSTEALKLYNKHKDNTTVTSFYTKKDQEEDKPDTCMTFNKNYVEMQGEKPFDEKGNKIQPVVQGVYKDRPPIKIDINTGKPFSNDLVPYKPPLVSTMKPAPQQGRLQNVKVTKKQKPDNHKPSISKQELIDKLFNEF